MALLTKEQILNADDITFEEIDVPEWSGTVRLKVMSGSERDSYEAAIYEIKGKDVRLNRDDMRAKLLARTLIDENGNRLFPDAEIRMLGKKSSKALDRLYEVAQRINGLSREAVEDAEKNS